MSEKVIDLLLQKLKSLLKIKIRTIN